MQLPNCWVSIAVICIQYVLCVTSGKLYTLYKDSHTWHEVYEVCRSQGLQMLRFKTAEELCVIKSVVEKWRNDSHLKPSKHGAIWIGLYDLAPDSCNAASFKWTDCTGPGKFIKLAQNEDNKDGLQNCVQFTHDHELRKKKCTNKYATVCEKETTKVEHLSPRVPKKKSSVGMCSDTVTNGSTSVLSCSTGTTKTTATAPAATESTTQSDVRTVETESASKSEKITSASYTTTPKATAKTPAASASTPKSDVTTSESDVTTVKSESAQTPDATTSSNGKTTPVMQLPENLCPNCTTTNNTCVWLSSAGPSVEEMKELIKILTLEKKTLSSYRREKTSASDDRPTAQAIGKVGIVFIVLAFAGVVLLDCGRVVDCLRKRNRKRVIFSKA